MQETERNLAYSILLGGLSMDNIALENHKESTKEQLIISLVASFLTKDV